MILKPVEIPLSQIYRGVASRGGASAETIDTEEEKTNLPQGMDSSADSPGTITEAEFTGYFVAGAAPVTVQTQDGKTYQISVNPDGTTQVQEEVQDEESPDLTPALAGAETEDDAATREALENYLRTVRDLRAKVKEAIDRSDKELDEIEQIAEKKHLEKVRERIEAALARLEARLVHAAGLSDADRAAIEAQIDNLNAILASLEDLASGLENGTISPEAVEAKLDQEIEVQLAGLEKNLNDEEIGILVAVFGVNYSEYVTNPETALEDGVLTAADLTETGKEVAAVYLGDLNSDQEISFGDLQALRDGVEGNYAPTQAREEFAQFLGLGSPTIESNLAFKEILEAARAGTLDADRWNEILDENGFAAEDSDDTYHITDDAFEASFFAEKGGDKVSGAIDLYRGLHRTYLNIVMRWGMQQIGDAFQVYIKENDFVFVDFELQSRVLYSIFAEAYSQAHDGTMPTAKDLIDWLLSSDAAVGLMNISNDGLKEAILELSGRRSFYGTVVDIPESELTAEQKRFQALMNEESPDYNPQLAWGMVVPLALNRIFNSIRATGDSEPEMYRNQMRIFEKLMTAIQEGGESVLSAYENEVLIVLIYGGRDNIDYQAILDGEPNPLEEFVLPGEEGTPVTAGVPEAGQTSSEVI
ncbi:hypothetical protein HZC35_04445 [Candidatus Saganbacteria bacterium]|nr:hypothetical protein [Candidatus Saganbacteria bacterium]